MALWFEVFCSRIMEVGKMGPVGGGL